MEYKAASIQFLRGETDESPSFMVQMTRIYSVKHSRLFA